MVDHTTSSSPESPPPGDDLFVPDELVGKRYVVRRLVGKGGMGEVYEAEDRRTGKCVALKTVKPELMGNSKILRRFEREIEFSRRIDHHNVLEIFDVFQTPIDKELNIYGNRLPVRDEVPCMVMEFLEGETVADRLVAGHQFTPEETLPIVCQVAAALSAAHAAEIVHRDLKPDNMFLVREQDGDIRVVLTDFGVAREAGAGSGSRDDALTASNVVIGTPEYMAPEQLELEAAMPASDIYTLGLVAFEMLTGKPAFQADSPIKMVFMRVQEDAPSPREHVPDLPSVWEDVVLRCLERDPQQRYADAADLIVALDGDDSRWLRSEHRGGGVPAWVWITGVLLIILGLAVALSFNPV